MFFYGTLQPGANTAMSRWAGLRCIEQAAARIPGRLVAVREGPGWYPALLPPGDAVWVLGTYARLELKPGELSVLDRYEGREYRRVPVRARLSSGARRAAQAYLWRIAIPGGAPIIGDGDFLGWLARNRQQAIGTHSGT
jgi:gamma-glutamylcyclotransferase (GGCT)/AIG2-like uncharacterized protein YtfP